jgi:N-acetylglucosaminyl-diphospho-decaprenol L-rhamnosyltransferase
MNKIDIVILNYNGAEILPQCLPSIVEASKRSPLPCQVIVLDNKSPDNSLDYIRKNFPQVKIEIAKENKVLFSYNDLIPKLDSDIIILLNNDIKVNPDFIAPLISHFSSPDIFAVAPKQMNFNGIGYNGGKNKIQFNFGMIKAGQDIYGDNAPIMELPGHTFYCANAAFNRRIFLELGGFDEIYAPFTWEDTDLGYRAWKSGYKLIYEPKSVIYHNESYTFDRETRNIRNRRIITRRNSFIFTWKNISDPRLLLTHIILLPWNLLSGIFTDWARIAAFFEALKYIPKIIAKRKLVKYAASDSSLLKMP